MSKTDNLELQACVRAMQNIKMLRKEITFLYGKKCPDYYKSCIVCSTHRKVDSLERIIKSDEKDFLEELA